MEQLPEEVLLHVLGFLDEAADLARACLVNHTWHILACDDAVWRELAVGNRWPLPQDVEGAIRDTRSKLGRSSYLRRQLPAHHQRGLLALSAERKPVAAKPPATAAGTKFWAKRLSRSRHQDREVKRSRDKGKEKISDERGAEGENGPIQVDPQGSNKSHNSDLYEGTGLWKEWYILTLVDRVLDGKTESECVFPHDKVQGEAVEVSTPCDKRTISDEGEEEDSESSDSDEEQNTTTSSSINKISLPSRQVVVSTHVTLSEHADNADDEELTEDLQGGTVWGILNFLLTEALPYGEKAMAAFLATHTVFTHSGYVLELLVEFFEGSAHKGASRTFRRLWTKYKGHFTQTKVLFMLEKWLSKYPRPFIRTSPFTSNEPSPQELRDRLEDFLTRASEHTHFEKELTALRAQFDVVKAIAVEEVEASSQVDRETTEQVNNAVGNDSNEGGVCPTEESEEELNEKYSQLELLKASIKSDVLARQLTLLDYDQFQSLNHEELLEQRWKRLPKLCPNIKRIVRHFNHVSGIVTTSIVLEQNAKARASVIKKWVSVAEKCLELNNINCALDVVSGIGSSPIFRLNKTWDRISKSTQKRLEMLQSELSRRHSYKRLRDRLFTLSPPAIPYLGMYLVDLSFISDGNPQTLEVDWPECTEVPCWPYFYMTGNAINHLLSFQGHPFSFPRDDELCTKLHRLDYLSSERCYQLSLIREPREVGRAPSKSAPVFEAW